MTGNDLLAASMRAAGLLALGEPVDADSAAAGRIVLNQMLESWGAQLLNVFTLNRNTFSLVAGTASYTLGTGGVFNIPRPAILEYVTIISNANPAQPVELPPLKLFNDIEWASEVPVKSVTNPLPQGVYDDGGFPLRTLTYWPVPSDSSVQTVIGGTAALSQFPNNLGSDVTFPPGYMEAIKYNLAVRLAADWQGQVSGAVSELARSSLAVIKGSNVQEIKMNIDPAMASEGGHYNWLTDRFQ